ncbi:hypothetical protein ACWA2B_08595 [Paenibacillus sp. CMM36]
MGQFYSSVTIPKLLTLLNERPKLSNVFAFYQLDKFNRRYNKLKLAAREVLKQERIKRLRDEAYKEKMAAGYKKVNGYIVSDER